MKWHVVAARYKHEQGDGVDRWIGPHLMRLGTVAKGKRELLWGLNGISGYSIEVRHLEIVHTYGDFQGFGITNGKRNVRRLNAYDAPDELSDKAYYDFDRRFPPQPDWFFKVSEGLISPDGVWYSCTYGEHSSLIAQLFRLYYDNDYHFDLEGAIKERGWVIVRASLRYPLGLDGNLNPQQERAIRLLHQDDSEMGVEFKKNSEFCLPAFTEKETS